MQGLVWGKPELVHNYMFVNRGKKHINQKEAGGVSNIEECNLLSLLSPCSTVSITNPVGTHT